MATQILEIYTGLIGQLLTTISIGPLGGTAYDETDIALAEVAGFPGTYRGNSVGGQSGMYVGVDSQSGSRWHFYLRNIADTYFGSGSVLTTNLLNLTGSRPASIAAGDIATDAITAASVKADAVTKIQAGLSSHSTADVWGAVDRTLTAFGFSTGLATQSSVDDIPTNTEMEARTLVAASYATAVNQVTINNNVLAVPGAITIDHGSGSYQTATGFATVNPDNAGIATGAASAATAASQATAANSATTTILARIGAFTGTGLNTILGFLRAMMSKAASLTPSDVGGTFNNVTDSEESIRDAVGTLGGGVIISVVVPTAVAAESAEINTITAIRGDTLRRSFTDLGNMSTRTKVWFTAKADPDDADSASIIQITEDDGLLVLDGAVAINPALASIVIDDEDSGDLTIYIDETIMVGMDVGQLFFDIQWNSATDTATPTNGKLVVVRDVTKAVA